MRPQHCRHHMIPCFSWTVQTPSQRQLTLVPPLPLVENFYRPSWSNLFLGWFLTDLTMSHLFVPTCTCGNAVFQCDFFLSLWYLTPCCTTESNYTPHLLWWVLQDRLFQSLMKQAIHSLGHLSLYLLKLRVHYPCVQCRGNTSLEGLQLHPLHIK